MPRWHRQRDADSFEAHQVEHLDQSFVGQLFALIGQLSPATAVRIASSSGWSKAR